MPKAKSDGGPAFPQTFEAFSIKGCEGMTLRDYFAAKAMQGMLAFSGRYTRCSTNDALPMKDTAEYAYKYADALLKVRGEVMSTLREKMLAVVKKTCIDCDRVPNSCEYCCDAVDGCLEAVREALPGEKLICEDEEQYSQDDYYKRGYNAYRTTVLEMLEGK